MALPPIIVPGPSVQDDPLDLLKLDWPTKRSYTIGELAGVGIVVDEGMRPGTLEFRWPDGRKKTVTIK